MRVDLAVKWIADDASHCGYCRYGSPARRIKTSHSTILPIAMRRGAWWSCRAIAAALLFSTEIIAPAQAAIITYTLSGTLNGVLDGDPFAIDTIFTGVAIPTRSTAFSSTFRRCRRLPSA